MIPLTRIRSRRDKNGFPASVSALLIHFTGVQTGDDPSLSRLPGGHEACGQCPREHLPWGIQCRHCLVCLLCPPEDSQRWRKDGGKENTEFSVTLFLPQSPVWQQSWVSLVTCLHKATRLTCCTASPVILRRQPGDRSSFSLLPEEEQTGQVISPRSHS